MLERRVREAWSVQDATLITSIYAPHVSVRSPRARANPKPGTNRRFALQNTYQTRPRARTARAWRQPASGYLINYKHLCASSGSMLERRVRGVRLENSPAISLARNITNSTSCANRTCAIRGRLQSLPHSSSSHITASVHCSSLAVSSS